MDAICKVTAMEDFERESSDLNTWKQYSLQLRGEGVCGKCGESAVLYRTLRRGYETIWCFNCLFPGKQSRDEFLSLTVWLSCPACHARMEPIAHAADYGFGCQACEMFLPLHKS